MTASSPSVTAEEPALEPQLLGDSPPMVALRTLIRRVAGADSTVLIQGESGTGKELVARLLHAWSPRALRPFAGVNCGAIPGELMESELFGHERGAFTGAQAMRKGRFELAGRGTLFLDEIAEMAPPLQVKILRVLQERTFERVGGSETLQAPARIVAATHRDLEQQIQLGRFREDLFYRLHVVPIQIPPLRDRGEDILLLAYQALRQLDASGLGHVRLGDGVVKALLAYRWPGNVRELHNLMERLVILHGGSTVTLRELPPKMLAADFQTAAVEPLTDTDDGLQDLMRLVADPSVPALPSQGVDLRAYLERIERSFIEQALAASNDVIAHAAGKLGLRRTTLVEKIRKYGLRAAVCEA
ncbi:MAG: sigma-54-dependent Fis family transcriptional regulator [Proteobacteria bacterium]|nr:sigma-54-dependent Fis family transcriptional regulator [Pseudomonadota bacterium]